jgi:3-oxoacyl-[acyl-carrier protein] reductase
MNKVMVITGTRKGIGRYLVEYYLNKGLVVLGCSRSQTDLEHENYTHFCLDIADEAAVKKMISWSYRKYKKIDYLLNNAGIASMNHSLLTPLNVAKKVFRTNVFGTFLFCREVGKIMMKREYGRIVNFTSVAVPLNLEGEAIYAASKSAVETLTKVLAKELGRAGITCNAIGPSPIKTDLIKKIPEEKIQRLLEKQTINKFANFENVSNAVDFFISEECGMVTAHILYLGGVS